MKKIRILNLNHIGGKTGSAQFIDTLMQGLPIDEFDFTNLVGYGFLPQKNTISLYKTNQSRLYRTLRYKSAIGLNFLFDRMTPGCIDMNYLHKFKPYIDADIVHLHCIQGGYFDWRILPELSKEKKIVLTMHDDWIVSGNDPVNLFHPYKTKKQYLKRKKIFKNSNITYIGVSNWITEKAIKDGIVTDHQVKTIYNGINTTIFNKKNKESSRKALGLPLNKKIILSIAGSGGKSNAKGLQYVNKIRYENKNNTNFLFVTLGNYENKKVSDNLWEIGYVNQHILSTYFNSADVFLYPTLMDSFGLVVAESISCGCPVVTFRTGGVPEIVQHQKDSYVARFKDYSDLCAGFKRVLKHTLSTDLDKKFTQENMVKEYRKIYLSLFQ